MSRDTLPPLAPGWDVDPLYTAPPSDNEEARPRRAGCSVFVVAVLLAVAWRVW